MTKKQDLIQAVQEAIEAIPVLCTFRQLYYQLVAKQKIANTLGQYKYLNKIITEARYAGIIPYDAIVDDKRVPSVSTFYEDDIDQHIDSSFNKIKNYIDTYGHHRWKNQTKYVEVWIEKQALFRLFRQITDRYMVTLVACGGYPSVSLLNQSAQRIRDQVYERDVNDVTILYFGDYDPTGKDIPRNIVDKLTTNFDIEFDMELIALNIDQIEFYELPPVPAKKTDSRSEAFIHEYGDMSVELDALDPIVLQDKVDEAICNYFDNDIYNRVRNEQDRLNERLRATYKLFADEIDTIAEQFKSEYERS